MLFGPVVQLAYYVDDPIEAAERWAQDRGAGPFFVREHIAVGDVVYRGRPSSFDHTSAYGQWGAVMVELFTQHDDAPSAVRERFARGETGLHHMARFVDDFAAAAEASGDRLAMTARSGSTAFAFVDARDETGHYWELYEGTERLRGFYRMVADAAVGWDGRDAVRLMS